MAKHFVCITCHSVGRPKVTTQGSFMIEVILWCFFLVPGICYSLWRLGNTTRVCRCCGNSVVIPANSPLGEVIAARTLTPPTPRVGLSVLKGGKA